MEEGAHLREQPRYRGGSPRVFTYKVRMCPVCSVWCVVFAPGDRGGHHQLGGAFNRVETAVIFFQFFFVEQECSQREIIVVHDV